MVQRRYGVLGAGAAIASVLFCAPFVFAQAYAGPGGSYAGGISAGYGGYGYQQQPVAMPYGGGYGGGYGGYQPSYQYGNSYSQPLDHNWYNPNTFSLSSSQMFVPVSYNQAQQYVNGGQYPYPGGNGGYGNYGSYGNTGYGGYGNTGYGTNYGTGYGPYLPSTPPYDSGYAPYSNYYQAYPQVPHYMTGDTNLLGQQLCRWADYSSANMPCGWDPQQWVYDPWTGSYY